MKIVRVPMSSLESRKENQGFLDGQSWPWIKSGRVPGRLLIKTVRVPMSLLDFHEFPRVPATVSKFRSLQKTGTHNAVVSAPASYWGFTWRVSGFPGVMNKRVRVPWRLG